MLGVPTVIDRMIQQAIVQVLQPIYEPLFSGNSYGFRPKRSAQQAMKQASEFYNAGYTQVVDLDLAKYFDTVNHEILIGMLREQVRDENAWRWANSRKAYWHIANSYILAMSLTNKYLASVGYDDILERYKVLHINY